MWTDEPASARRGEDRASPDSLLARCQLGDESAWEQLVGQFERLVYSIALHEGLSVEDAADVTQTVFEALVASLARIEDDSRLAAWLATVTRRHAWRVRNRNRRDQTRAGEWDAGTGPITLPTFDPTEDIARSVALYAAVQKLGEPCAGLLTALYFEQGEPSYAEVAVRLGRPVGSIGPTRARCLRRLKLLLDEETS